MASPQAENGHVDIANEIVDALAGIRISGEEMQCLWVILRKTYGWKKKFDWIALSQFEGMTGIKRPNIVRALSKLIDKNIVIKKDNRINISYGFQKDYKTWKPLSKKITVIKKDKAVIKKDKESLSKKIHTKDNSTKDTNTKESIYGIFEFWNDLGITKHRTLDKFGSNITAALKSYSEDEIKNSMDNYKVILNDPIYYWTHKWTLKEFLQRGLDKFADENNPFGNYKSKSKGQTQSQNNKDAAEQFLRECSDQSSQEKDITPTLEAIE